MRTRFASTPRAGTRWFVPSEPDASRDRQPPELLLQAHRVVLGRELRVEALCFERRLATLRDVGADLVDLLLERRVGLGREPGIGERFFERLRATEVAEHDVDPSLRSG
jgi:hypothetical protein